MIFDSGSAPSYCIFWSERLDTMEAVLDEEELETLFEKLSDGGEVAITLGEHGYSTKFGWVQDRFGGSWQLNFGELVFE